MTDENNLGVASAVVGHVGHALHNAHEFVEGMLLLPHEAHHVGFVDNEIHVVVEKPLWQVCVIAAHRINVYVFALFSICVVVGAFIPFFNGTVIMGTLLAGSTFVVSKYVRGDGHESFSDVCSRVEKLWVKYSILFLAITLPFGGPAWAIFGRLVCFVIGSETSAAVARRYYH
jgi:hypothetical protein